MSSSIQPTLTPAASTFNISIVGSSLATFAFTPSSIQVLKGTTINWTNTSPSTHTVTSDTGLWDSGFLAPGASFTRSFNTAGVFSYHCSIHPSMTGSITVLDLSASSLTLFLSSYSVARGASLTLQGDLTPALATNVYLYYQVKGTLTWTNAATLTTDSTGHYMFTATVPSGTPTGTYLLLTYWPGTAAYAPIISNNGVPVILTIT